jgi:membrane associated rhomboid family serine protease
MKISYNAPVILSFALVCLLVMIIGTLYEPFIGRFFVLPGTISFSRPDHLFSLVSYIAGHKDWNHLMGNLLLLLLIGPIIEERYGSGRMFVMITITGVVTALLHLMLPGNAGLMGASGIAFMLMVLCSLVNFKKGEVPLTFILIAVLFIGKEILTGLQADHISQFAHIVGGLCGGLFGFRSPNKGRAPVNPAGLG